MLHDLDNCMRVISKPYKSIKQQKQQNFLQFFNIFCIYQTILFETVFIFISTTHECLQQTHFSQFPYFVIWAPIYVAQKTNVHKMRKK